MADFFQPEVYLIKHTANLDHILESDEYTIGLSAHNKELLIILKPIDDKKRLLVSIATGTQIKRPRC